MSNALEEQRTATIHCSRISCAKRQRMRRGKAEAQPPKLFSVQQFRDLFRIESDLFELSEKMMTRRTKYLQTSAETIPRSSGPPPIIVTRIPRGPTFSKGFASGPRL